MLLVDTAALNPADREAAMRATLAEMTLPTRLAPPESGDALSLRLRVWQLDGEAVLINAEGAGLRLSRTSLQQRSTDEPLVAVTVQPFGRAQFAQDGYVRVVQPGSLLLADMREQYDFIWRGRGQSATVQISLDRLNMTRDEFHLAASRVRAGPLHDLVRDHVCGLARHPTQVDAAGSDVLQATTDLIRALLISSLTETTTLIDDDARWTAVQTYVRWHCQDATLDRKAFGVVLGIPDRDLDRLAAAHGQSVEKIVEAQRLAGAYRDLNRSLGRSRGTTWVSRRWGFADVHQFRNAFMGMYGADPDDPCP